MAEGPALKLVHCTLTCGPMAFSNQPLALPTMACGCVTLGNAPTRITVCADAAQTVRELNSSPVKNRRITSPPPDHHGQNAGFFFFLPGPLAPAAWAALPYQIRQSRIFQNVRRRIANIQKQLI